MLILLPCLVHNCQLTNSTKAAGRQLFNY